MRFQRHLIRKAKDQQITNNDLLEGSHAEFNIDVEDQIKKKINTFINWDVRQSTKTRQSQKKTNKQEQSNQQQNMIKAMLKFAEEMKRKQKLKIFSKKGDTNLTNGGFLLQNQRERFKRVSNPLQFIDFYCKSNKFNPNKDQSLLIDKLVQIKAFLESMETLHLDKVLEEIYILMNMAVDSNELRLIVVATVLSADICFQAKDYKRAAYFYQQAKISGQFSGFTLMVTQAWIGLGQVAIEVGLWQQSIKFLKKSLAYAWKQGDTESQTKIYDLLGQAYCKDGRMKQAAYYHEKFAKSYQEKQTSAIRKIYMQILKDEEKSRNLRLYSQNADKLFLETVILPIFNFNKVPKLEKIKEYANYFEGQSPRKFIQNKNFHYSHFKSAQILIQKILMSRQFEIQMPEPNLQSLHQPSSRYSKKRRSIDFNDTVEFHELTGTKFPTTIPETQRRYTLDKQIQIIMSSKPDPKWYQKMSEKVRRERMQKLGSLKDPVRRSASKHERSRSCAVQSENIRKSVNKAILSWIDPAQ